MKKAFFIGNDWELVDECSKMNFAVRQPLHAPLKDRQQVNALTLYHRTVKRYADLTGLYNRLIFMGGI